MVYKSLVPISSAILTFINQNTAEKKTNMADNNFELKSD